MNDWWLTARTPAGVYAWPLGDPGPVEMADLVWRARALLDWPYADVVDGWDMSMSPDVPHPRAGADLRDIAQLRGVAVEAVQAWRVADDNARGQTQLDQLAAAVTALPEQARTVLRSRLGWGATPKPEGKI